MVGIVCRKNEERVKTGPLGRFDFLGGFIFHFTFLYVCYNTIITNVHRISMKGVP